MKVLVTGANGFVGAALIQRLLADESAIGIVGAIRGFTNTFPIGVKSIVVGDINGANNWRDALIDCEVVIHLAARVHVMKEVTVDPLMEFRRVNVQGTLNLARQAAATGVRRFVFISSVKVNGEETQLGKPFTADDVPTPFDAYGISKLEAEQGLLQIALQTGMEVVIIRPPLVYGLGVKANFATMMRWLRRGVPLPLGAIHNQRSLVALDNMVDLIVTCLTHPAAVGQIFLVSDGEDISTTELLRRMGHALSRPARLLPVPAGVLKLIGAMAGKQDVAQRLCGSLQVDIEKTRQLLGWCPPLTLDQGLKKAAEGI
ncbi:MAG: SDR family oxidoreductase [Burkholderiaceae bacterium]